METLEEVSKVFKEFEEGVIARAHSISGLGLLNIRLSGPGGKEGTHGEENINSGEDETCRLEWNLVGNY